MNIFGCMNILWILFGGNHTISLYLGVISMHVSVPKAKEQNEEYFFLVAKISNIIGVLEIPYILGAER